MSQRRVVREKLRDTVELLPPHTKQAMLEGIRNDRIIVGAYTDSDGGVCPMLSAHRRGGRTSLVDFARNWDSFTMAPNSGFRNARAGELQVLEQFLVESISKSQQRLAAAPTLRSRRHRAENREASRVSDQPQKVAYKTSDASSHDGYQTQSIKPQAVRTAKELLAATDRFSARVEIGKAERVTAAHQAVQRQSDVVRSVSDVPEVAPQVSRTTADSQGSRLKLPSWMKPLRTLAEYQDALSYLEAHVAIQQGGDTMGPSAGQQQVERQPSPEIQI